jgi:hypothetical protein
MGCDMCRTLLSEGLDLCVRARKLDMQERTNIEAEMLGDEALLERRAARHNALYPDAPILTRSATIPMWVQEQYETDQANWERRSRHHLTQGCPTPSAKEPDR